MSKKLWIGFSVSAALLFSLGLGQKAFATTLVPQTLENLTKCGQNSLIVEGEIVDEPTYGTNITGEFPATTVVIKIKSVIKGDNKTKAGATSVPLTFFGRGSTTIKELAPPAKGEKGMFFINGESQKGLRNFCGGIGQGLFRDVNGNSVNGIGNKGLQVQEAATKLMQTRAGVQPVGGNAKNLEMVNASMKRLQAVQEGQPVPTADFRTLVQEMVNQNYPTPTNNGQQ